MSEVLDRLESGESPESIDATMPDAGDGGIGSEMGSAFSGDDL